MLSDDAITRTVADELPAGIWVARAPNGEFVYANRAFLEIMGMEARADVAVGEYAQPYGIHDRSGALYPESQLPFVRALAARAPVVVDDLVIHRPDGTRVYIRAQARPVFEGEAISHVVIAFIDITREIALEDARKDVEQRLAHAQRMESVGKLAGGIAHDFNNLLSVVRLVGSSLRRGETSATRLEDLKSIDEVVESAATLTRSLLGFAGRGRHRTERVSLDALATSLLELVVRTVESRITLRSDLRSRAEVLGDRAQLEQVLMNLLDNACDAIPDVGEIRIRTRATDLDEVVATSLGLLPGPHVIVDVEDDGTGIDPRIRDRIFEPYLTTKITGQHRGTGLGLATVYGIVQAHAGAVEVLDTTPHGTLVRVFLPRAPAGEGTTTSGELAAAMSEASGTILVVEDEPLVRAAAIRAIRGMGYDVVAAEDGAEAVRVFSERASEIDAVVLDMIMPRMGGRAAFAAMREIDPALQVVIATGYAAGEDTRALLQSGVEELLEKPYGVEALADVLSRLVSRRRAAREGREPG